MLLSDEEITNLYVTTVKRPAEYFELYQVLPPCPVASWNYSWNGRDFPRTRIILDFRDWINKYGIVSNDIGVTCKNDPEVEFIPYTTLTEIPYPPNDLHVVGETYPSSFDFFLFSQTLEHLQDPSVAIKSVYETLKPGGYCFTSVPTINIPHSTPYHYGGYNPMGLAIMFVHAGFEIKEIGQWGNRAYIAKMFEMGCWPDYAQIQQNGVVTNEEFNVCQCWILAQKPVLSNNKDDSRVR